MDSSIDEIVVTGQRSMRLLRRDAQEATENFYMRLNAVLDNDDFRVTCRNERQTGTRIMRRVCRTGFQDDELRRMGDSAFAYQIMSEDGDAEYFVPAYDPSPALMARQREYNEAVMEAVNTDPELNEAVQELLRLREVILERERGSRD